MVVSLATRCFVCCVGKALWIEGCREAVAWGSVVSQCWMLLKMEATIELDKSESRNGTVAGGSLLCARENLSAVPKSGSGGLRTHYIFDRPAISGFRFCLACRRES